MADPTNLMPIGQFSSLSRLSIRMLRHYDAHGVLAAAHVDPASGYRRYAPQQLRDAANIRTLRDIGFGVSAISALLAARGTPTWERALRLHRAHLVGELRQAQGRLTLIDRLLDPGETMPITIDRTTVPALTVVSLRGTVPTYADEGRLWEQLMPLLHRAGIDPRGPGGCIEHDGEYKEHDVDLSVFVPVAPGTRVDAPLSVLDLPARDCLRAHVVGPYQRIGDAYRLMVERVDADGLRPRTDDTLAAKGFSRYLTTPDQVGPDELVTEVYLPLG